MDYNSKRPTADSIMERASIQKRHSKRANSSHLNLSTPFWILLHSWPILIQLAIVVVSAGATDDPISSGELNGRELYQKNARETITSQRQDASTSFPSVNTRNNSSNKSTKPRSHQSHEANLNELAARAFDDSNRLEWRPKRQVGSSESDSTTDVASDYVADNQDQNSSSSDQETSDDVSADMSQDYIESSSKMQDIAPIRVQALKQNGTGVSQATANTQLPVAPAEQAENRQISTLHRRTAPQLFASDQQQHKSRPTASNSNNLQQVVPTMNVNMGAEKILIKSANERAWLTLPPTTTLATSPPTTSLNSLQSDSNKSPNNKNNNDNLKMVHRDSHELDDGDSSERHHHLDLLYPSPTTLDSSTTSEAMDSSTQHAIMHELRLHQQQQQQAAGRLHSGASLMMLPTSDFNARMDQLGAGGTDTQFAANGPQICYTPITLMLVIMITMTATLVIAILSHYTMKQFSRRQFDLIESTKQFNTEHRRGQPNQNRFQAPATIANAKPIFMLGAASNPRGRSRDSGGAGDDEDDYIDHLGPIGSDCKPNGMANNRNVRQTRCLTANELEHFAFDNPYFRGECDLESSASQLEHTLEGGERNKLQHKLTHNLDQQQNHSTATTATNLTADSSLTSQQRRQRRNSAGLLAVVGQQHQSPLISSISNSYQGDNSSLGNGNAIAPALPISSSDGPGLQSFIENHISNLHSRQVTSSVKELTIHSGRSPDLKLSIGPNCELRESAIVDLRHDPTRMVNAKEGDLVAVNLSGQDFIGLGFDICGNVREGIFVSSILASGPARNSGLVHRGDRIKCLNISFEGITLEDARDILNCGAPYKLRLLLEKGKESARHSSAKSSMTNYSQTSTIGTNQKRARSKTMNFLTDPGANSTNSQTSFLATKSFIKTKLCNLVSDQKNQQQHSSSKSVNRDSIRTSPGSNKCGRDNNSMTTSQSESELKGFNIAKDLQQPGQGSLANKRHLSSGEGMLNLSTVGSESITNFT